MAVVTIGHLGYPYVRDALIAIAFPLMLPAIAVLHLRHAPSRASGAVLGTLAGGAAVVAGLGGSVNVDLQPAALFILGMWWWTIGKLWVETAVLPRALGAATAALGALTLGAGLFAAVSVGLSAVRPGFPDVPVWPLAEVALGAWLLVLATTLSRAATPPLASR